MRRPDCDVALPLRSWTRNVPPEEALALLDLASPGGSQAAWSEAAGEALPHQDPTYRKTLLRLVGRMFLDLDEDTILESPWLRLVQEGPDQRRSDLFFARYALAHVWPLQACREVVAPALAQGDEPEVAIDTWDAWVDGLIEADASVASRRKTRSTVIGALVGLGVVVRGAASTAPTTLKHGRPDPLAFGWAVREQIEGQLLDGMPVEAVVTTSDAARLFAVEAEYGRACLRAAVGRKLLSIEEVDGVETVRVGAG